MLKSKFLRLKYGENPHQIAYLFNIKNNWLKHLNIINNVDISYNNVLDIDFGLKLMIDIRYLGLVCIIIKHGNPSGISIKMSGIDAYNSCFKQNSLASFGGIIIFNYCIDEIIASIISEMYYEIIVLPSITLNAFKILKKKKKLKIIILNIWLIKNTIYEEKNLGNLVIRQTSNNIIFENIILKIVTFKLPIIKQLLDMKIAFMIVKHLKSNAITIINNNQYVNSCWSRISRIEALINVYNNWNYKINDYSMASDAFLPFIDSILYSVKIGVNSIIQPGGSIKDRDIILICNKFNICMVLTNNLRCFKH